LTNKLKIILNHNKISSVLFKPKNKTTLQSAWQQTVGVFETKGGLGAFELLTDFPEKPIVSAQNLKIRQVKPFLRIRIVA